jgi:hypothetical protein
MCSASPAQRVWREKRWTSTEEDWLRIRGGIFWMMTTIMKTLLDIYALWIFLVTDFQKTNRKRSPFYLSPLKFDGRRFLLFASSRKKGDCKGRRYIGILQAMFEVAMKLASEQLGYNKPFLFPSISSALAIHELLRRS